MTSLEHARHYAKSALAALRGANVPDSGPSHDRVAKATDDLRNAVAMLEIEIHLGGQ